MITDCRIRVGAEQAGKRADLVVADTFPGSSRSLIRMAFANDWIRVNGRRCAPSHSLAAGDVIEVERLYEVSDRRIIPRKDLPLQVLYEDDWLIAVDKPAGWPVHPVRVGESHTLASALVARYPECAGIGDPFFPAFVHRLDGDTSGVVLAARSAAAHGRLREQFRRHMVTKEYAALVWGHPPPQGVLSGYLAHDRSRPGRMIAAPSPRTDSGRRWMWAETRFRVAARYASHALLDIRITTGVTHQIRCQLAAAGFPVVGDQLYGGLRTDGTSAMRRHFLHATGIVFRHPADGRKIHIRSPLPPELRRILDQLNSE